jgi:hypothetical protein
MMISNGNKNIDIIDLSIDDDENDKIVADKVTNYDIIKNRFSSKLPFEISDIPKNKLKVLFIDSLIVFYSNLQFSSGFLLLDLPFECKCFFL